MVGYGSFSAVQVRGEGSPRRHTHRPARGPPVFNSVVCVNGGDVRVLSLTGVGKVGCAWVSLQMCTCELRNERVNRLFWGPQLGSPLRSLSVYVFVAVNVNDPKSTDFILRKSFMWGVKYMGHDRLHHPNRSSVPAVGPAPCAVCLQAAFLLVSLCGFEKSR